MSRRSRKHRKHFACSHRGFGKFCHRCADEEKKRQIVTITKEALQQEKQLLRQLWIQSFSDDCIDLTHLPKKIVLRARHILKKLEQGTGFWELGGKRLSFDRSLIRIPVTYRYRLVGRLVDHNFVPIKVVSHETYNRITRIGVG